MAQSIEAAVGQMLMISVQGGPHGVSAHTLIEQVGVGGVIGYAWANDFSTSEKVISWTSGLKDLASKAGRPTPLISVDAEGGRVWRFSEGVTHFPSAGNWGQIGDSDLVARTHRAMADELCALGFNCNLAPCSDVLPQEGTSFIGDRSFGNDPALVTALASQALQGLVEGGVAACLKHFPGHGSVVDTHQSKASLLGTVEQ